MPGKKADAEAFSRKWANRGNENQDTQLFWMDFFQNVLGLEDAVSRLEFEKPVSTAASSHEGYIDVFVPSAKTLIEQKSLGIDLSKEETRQGRKVTPAQQGLAYAQGIPLSQQPRYIIACNFSDFWVYDRERDSLCREPVFRLSLSELPKNLAAVQFLKGAGEAPTTISRAVSVKAGKIMARLHDLVAESFDDPDTPENHHALSVLMTRLMFLMFCEDAGLIAPNAFRDYVAHFQAGDLRRGLKDLFVWLDTPDAERDKYAEDWLKRLPYMNGGLFRERTEIPPLSESFRHTLIVEGCQEFDWSGVSPTVFGSIFEGALSHDHRRANGQHFTSPENIHKVIDPLFLDGLKAEFDAACAKPIAGGARTRALKELHEKVGNISILDPAAGSGNFLTESYLCLRQLENRILFELQGNQAAFSFEEAGDRDVLVSLRNFHGIELEDFACCVARTALWIAEKQADADTAKVTQRVYQELPLTDYEGIVNANALRIDWNDVVSANDVDYILGNPPFIGQAMQSKEQSNDVSSLFDRLSNSGKLDYVAGWFKKAADYSDGSGIRCAFVSSNSICQGESVGSLWKVLSEEGCVINFAYTTFLWDSEASDKAGVMCVIIGFSMFDDGCNKILFGADGAKIASHINGYLKDAPDVWIKNRKKCINRRGCKVTQGSQPMEDGQLLFSAEEKERFLNKYPECEGLFRPYIGSREFLNETDFSRYCLWLDGVNPAEYASNAEIMKRIRAVREYRSLNKIPRIRKTAESPQLFTQIRQPKSDYVVIPRVSSARRKYIPIGYVSKNVVASDAVVIADGATMFDFGLLTSQVHNAWMRIVAGRLKNDYRYAPSVYYNFPYPDADQDAVKAIEERAKTILNVRSNYPDCSLATLYGADSFFLFGDLVKAHSDLDVAVESAYGVNFNRDEEKIVAHLFKLYAEKVGE